MLNFEDLTSLFHSSIKNRKIVRLNLDEAALLYRTAKLSTGNVVEIGTKWGGSALLLASAVHDDQVVYSIDIEKSPKIKSNFKKFPNDVIRKIKLINSDSYEASKKWDKQIGLLFVDGKHKYDYVKRDIKTWCPHVIIGGYAVFHDVRESRLPKLESLVKKMKKNGWKEMGSAQTLVVLKKER